MVNVGGKYSILSTFIPLNLFTQILSKICQGIPIKSEKQASLGKFSRTSGTLTGLDLSILRRAFNVKAHGFELVNDQVQFYCLLIGLTRSSLYI